MTDSIARQFGASIEWTIAQLPKRTFKSPCKTVWIVLNGESNISYWHTHKRFRNLSKNTVGGDLIYHFTTLRKVVYFTQKGQVKLLKTSKYN